MSVIKLLSRIADSESCATIRVCDSAARSANTSEQYLRTYEALSDPLTQFACIFSAIIHDVDHRGLSNQEMIVQDPVLAARYRNKSVAEQNSIDRAWSILMKNEFTALRQCIAETLEEQNRFRQLVVNCVIATDVMDSELKENRNRRWEQVFADDGRSCDLAREDVRDRKATIVVEHLIQASDISHTMQHWYVFRQWNERLFRERYQAYQDGFCPDDPSTTWYQSELRFFDSYVVPLAKKLVDCGVFGVSGTEYLGYATKNRQQWESQGRSVVAEMCERIKGDPAVRPTLHRSNPIRRRFSDGQPMP
jgi:3'5'-cyclic nucleotide phosphodiesterase